MQHSFNSFSELLFFVVFVTAIGILLYAFGWQIVKDARRDSGWSGGAVTSKQVGQYFMDKGYVVCDVKPVKNSTKWLVFLVKNSEYLIATVFTNGNNIEGYTDSLE